MRGSAWLVTCVLPEAGDSLSGEANMGGFNGIALRDAHVTATAQLGAPLLLCGIAGTDDLG